MTEEEYVKEIKKSSVLVGLDIIQEYGKEYYLAGREEGLTSQVISKCGESFLRKIIHEYEDECDGGEADYLDTEHLFNFLSKYFLIKEKTND